MRMLELKTIFHVTEHARFKVRECAQISLPKYVDKSHQLSQVGWVRASSAYTQQTRSHKKNIQRMKLLHANRTRVRGSVRCGAPARSQLTSTPNRTQPTMQDSLPFQCNSCTQATRWHEHKSWLGNLQHRERPGVEPLHWCWVCQHEIRKRVFLASCGEQPLAAPPNVLPPNHKPTFTRWPHNPTPWSHAVVCARSQCYCSDQGALTEPLPFGPFVRMERDWTSSHSPGVTGPDNDQDQTTTT